jgi:hypothetical protein
LPGQLKGKGRRRRESLKRLAASSSPATDNQAVLVETRETFEALATLRALEQAPVGSEPKST